jgi:hypothetical protein
MTKLQAQTLQTGQVVRDLENVHTIFIAQDGDTFWVYNPARDRIESADFVEPIGVSCYIPTLEEVQQIQVGDVALDCFGSLKPVVEIYGRGQDGKDRTYVLFKTQFSDAGSTITGDMTEGVLARTVHLTKYFNSHELDLIEKYLFRRRPHEPHKTIV